jgi:hypothetical protein
MRSGTAESFNKTWDKIQRICEQQENGQSEWNRSNVQVVMRVRPLSPPELQLSTASPASVVEVLNEKQVTVNQKYTFSFDRCFDSMEDNHGSPQYHYHQKEIFNSIGRSVLADAWSGFNATVIAYGYAGTGKSYTMHGNFTGGGGEDTSARCMGLIPRTCEHLFDTIQRKRTQLAAEAKGMSSIEGGDRCGTAVTLQVEASCVALQNDSFHDLFLPAKSKCIRIKESAQAGVFLDNATSVQLDTFEDMLLVMGAAMSNKRELELGHDGSEEVDEERVHFVLNLVFTQTYSFEGNNAQLERVSKIRFVDLAGVRAPNNISHQLDVPRSAVPRSAELGGAAQSSALSSSTATSASLERQQMAKLQQRRRQQQRQQASGRGRGRGRGGATGRSKGRNKMHLSVAALGRCISELARLSDICGGVTPAGNPQGDPDGNALGTASAYDFRSSSRVGAGRGSGDAGASAAGSGSKQANSSNSINSSRPSRPISPNSIAAASATTRALSSSTSAASAGISAEQLHLQLEAKASVAHHFRGFNLTMLLKEAFTGNSKTWVVGTLSPSETCLFETLGTLNRAQQAKKVQTRIRVNESAGARLVQHFRKEAAVYARHALQVTELAQLQGVEALTLSLASCSSSAPSPATALQAAHRVNRLLFVAQHILHHALSRALVQWQLACPIVRRASFVRRTSLHSVSPLGGAEKKEKEEEEESAGSGAWTTVAVGGTRSMANASSDGSGIRGQIGGGEEEVNGRRRRMAVDRGMGVEAATQEMKMQQAVRTLKWTINHWTKQQLARAWEGWRRSLRTMQQAAKLMRASVVRYMQQALFKGWFRWIQASSSGRGLGIVARRGAVSASNGVYKVLKEQADEARGEVTEERKRRVCSNIFASIRWWRQMAVVQAWRSWVQGLALDKRKKRAFGGISATIARWKHMAVTRSWSQWVFEWRMHNFSDTLSASKATSTRVVAILRVSVLRRVVERTIFRVGGFIGGTHGSNCDSAWLVHALCIAMAKWNSLMDWGLRVGWQTKAQLAREQRYRGELAQLHGDKSEMEEERDELRGSVERGKVVAALRTMTWSLNHWTKQQLARAWEGWQRAIKTMMRAAKLMKTILQRIDNSKLFAGWNRWRQVFEQWQHAGRLMQRCMVRIGNTQVAKGWQSWEMMMEEAKAADAKAELDGLNDEIKQKKLEHAVATVKWSLNHWTKQQLARAWEGWQRAIKTMMRAAKLMKTTLQRIDNSKLFAGWNRWRQVLEKMAWMKQLMRRVIRRIMQRDLAEGLNKWRETLAKRKMDELQQTREAEEQARAFDTMQRIVSHWTKQQLARGWEGWKSALATMWRAVKLVHMTMGRLGHSKVFAGWNRWRTYVRMAVELETLAAEAELDKKMTVAQKLLRSALLRMCQQNLAKALRQWANMIFHMKRQFLLKSTEGLREEMAKREEDLQRQRTSQCVRRCIARIQREGCAKGWTSWRKLLQSQNRAVMIMHKTGQRISHGKLFAGFNVWCAHVTSWARAGLKMHSCLARITMMQTAMAVGKWKELREIQFREAQHRNGQHKAVKLVERVVKNLCAGQTAAAWRKWALLAHKSKKVKAIVQMCVTRIRNITKARAMGKWKELRELHFRTAQQAKAKRQAVRTVSWIFKVWRNRTLAEVWRVWGTGQARAVANARAKADREERVELVSACETKKGYALNRHARLFPHDRHCGGVRSVFPSLRSSAASAHGTSTAMPLPRPTAAKPVPKLPTRRLVAFSRRGHAGG